jgi:hypothetical protein
MIRSEPVLMRSSRRRCNDTRAQRRVEADRQRKLHRGWRLGEGGIQPGLVDLAELGLGKRIPCDPCAEHESAQVASVHDGSPA